MSFEVYTTKTVEETFSELDTSVRGLREFVAHERLTTYGKNTIAAKETTWYEVLFRQFTSPFVYILFFASVLSFVTGGVIDSIIILVFILINAILGFFQEYHSERSLLALKQFVKSLSRVRRNNNEMLISTEELVPGDLLILGTGDIVPVDARVISVNNCSVNEESLTGESKHVFKSPDALHVAATAVHTASNIVFAGTSVVGGMAECIVLSTGSASCMGDVAKLAIETHRTSAFEQGISRFSRFILRMVVVITTLLFVVHTYIQGGNDLGETILFSIALAISVIPEALPVVTTIALSRGALSLAKDKVVVRRLSAIEDLGSIEVLASDKTGTLTENTLTVVGIHASDKALCQRYATLGSSFLGAKKRDPNNAFDLALWQKLSITEQETLKEYRYISERPFDPEKKTNSVLLSVDGKNILIVRGAPEVVVDVCPELSNASKKEILDWVAQEGELGRRTLAIAVKECDFDRAHCADDEYTLSFAGTISFADNLKSSAKEAIRKAKELGIQVKILTGDGPEVSRAVAREAGILVDDGELVYTGDVFERLTPEEKRKALEESHVFTRLNPKQKYEIIQYMSERHSVGFLGEGINDALALKLANVGLVVEGAADIARDASDIVLLNSSLLVIIEGVENGRKMFANIIKYLKITLTSNFGNFYSVAIASFLIPFLPMLPIQLLLLNLLSDFPMIAIATDTVDSSEVSRPRKYQSHEIIRVAILFGLLSTLFDLIIFSLFYQRDTAVLQTNWFIGSTLTELALIYSMRTMLPFWRAVRPGRTLSLLSIAGVVCAVFLPFLPFAMGLFTFIPPTMADLRLIFFVVAIYFVVTESAKLLYVKLGKLRLQKVQNI
ncbi:MAG: HAD-IC family P-type ATPase [Candidatus Pacebacteria bacterium]|jgi:Mg2+-importing ATPase|nr:HAD-IC family P-type ATPase [Candidatus Paceibacterota bacterium]